MKKLIFATLLIATTTLSAFSADVNKINSTVLSNFKSDFKKASDVNWKTGADFIKATFNVAQNKMEAFYNFQGELIATTQNISLDELPVAAKRLFAKRFGNYEVKEAIRMEATDEGSYYISAENEKESIIVKIDDNQQQSVYKRTKK